MLVACVTDLRDIPKLDPLADIVELRLDAFEGVIEKPNFPCIFTFRKKEQGGLKDISDPERLAQIEKLLELSPDYCDIEADTDPAFIAHIAKKFPNVKLIGSYHNFHETPSDLPALLQTLKTPHFSIYKIAVTAQSTADMLRLMIFAKEANEPLSVISMGEFGKPSRILGPLVGNVLDYAGLEEDLLLHRYSLKTLHEVFHYRCLNAQTKVFALIGDPVEQSPGYLFHNAHFKTNAVYIKMRLKTEELATFFQLIKKLPFYGFSVTMPLKEAIFPFLDAIEPEAQAIGAINTVIFRDKKAIGINTDAFGALEAIEKHLKVAGKRLAILGAGGSAKAIAYEAKRRGAVVSIYNRTLARAKQLAADLGCDGYGLEELKSYDLLVNTTPPTSELLPLLIPKTTIMDIVYHPKETPLLQQAKKLGCHCIYGEEMFIEQALLQQSYFH
jgi:3-dehydroquinate dehydratase/shikimate dehydrogenase